MPIPNDNQSVEDQIAGTVLGETDTGSDVSSERGGASDAGRNDQRSQPSGDDAPRQFQSGRDTTTQRRQAPQREQPREHPASNDDFDPSLFFTREQPPQRRDDSFNAYNDQPNVEDAFNEYDRTRGPASPVGFYNEDARGNLIDRDGHIIAAAGRGRKAFEQIRNFAATERLANIRMARNVLNLTQEMRDLFDKFKVEKQRKTLGEQFGLTDQEHRQAVELMSIARSDPATALKKVLTIAQVRGINISDLGATLGAADATEVAKEVERLRRENDEKDKAEKLKQDELLVRREINDFLASNPDANGSSRDGTPFIKYVVEAKTRFPQMSLEECWRRIKAAASGGGQRRGGQRQQPQTGGNGVSPVRQNQNRNAPRRAGINIDPAHPSATFEQIGATLLRDIRNQGL